MNASIKSVQGYTTTHKQDTNLLKKTNSKMTNNQRNCIILRAGEKKVYLHFAELGKQI